MLEGIAEPSLADKGALGFDVVALMESVGHEAKRGNSLLAPLIGPLKDSTRRSWAPASPRFTASIRQGCQGC